MRLDGSVPQRQRQELVHTFQNNPECRLFLTTNAGSTGLNLQAANTVINVDLPWNPAILEQRIARAHRMGQTQPVQVFVLVTEGTIEENLLATLASKKELALAALDVDSDVDAVDMASGMDELKGRLEVLLGAKPDGCVGDTVREESDEVTSGASINPKKRVAPANDGILGATFTFPDEVVVRQSHAAPPPEVLESCLPQKMSAYIEEDPAGKPRLTISLPNKLALENLAQMLATILAAGSPTKNVEQHIAHHSEPQTTAIQQSIAGNIHPPFGSPSAADAGSDGRAEPLAGSLEPPISDRQLSILIKEKHHGVVIHDDGNQVVIRFDLGDDVVEHVYDHRQFVSGGVPKVGEDVIAYGLVVRAEMDLSDESLDATLREPLPRIMTPRKVISGHHEF